MKRSELKLALIGCGGIAAGYGDEKSGHLLSLEKLGLRVHTYCDINLELARKRLAQYGGTAATDDPQAVMADKSIDAVIICTRSDSHVPLLVAAADAGKHVFVEKPLASTEAECLQAIEAQRRHPELKIMMGFSKRYTPAYKALIPLRGQAQLIVAQSTEHTWDAYDFWGKDPVAGGGQVYMCGIHMADMMLYLAGSEPTRILATGGPVSASGPTIINKAYALVDFANGSHGVFLSSDTGNSEFLSKFDLEFHVGKGVAVAHERLKYLSVTDVPGLQSIREDDEHFADVMADFVRCVCENAPLPATPTDGLRATRLVERVIQSIRKGGPVGWA